VRIRGWTKQQLSEEGNTDKQTRFQKNQILALKFLSVEHENKRYSSSPRTIWKKKVLLLLHLTASSVDSPFSLTRARASQQASTVGGEEEEEEKEEEKARNQR
jgi:hypothetical protein